MNIKVLELKDGKVVVTEICHTTKALSEILRVFEENQNYIKVLSLLFYMYCPDPERNDFLNIPELEKEDFLKEQFQIDFSLDEPAYEEGKKFFLKVFTTPKRQYYLDCKVALEKQGKYMREAEITSGRDGNDKAYLATLKSMADINDQFSRVEKDYEAEIQAAVRGGGEKSFDE